MSERRGPFLLIPLECRHSDSQKDCAAHDNEAILQAAIVLTIRLRIKVEEDHEEQRVAAS